MPDFLSFCVWCKQCTLFLDIHIWGVCWEMPCVCVLGLLGGCIKKTIGKQIMQAQHSFFKDFNLCSKCKTCVWKRSLHMSSKISIDFLQGCWDLSYLTPHLYLSHLNKKWETSPVKYISPLLTNALFDSVKNWDFQQFRNRKLRQFLKTVLFRPLRLEIDLKVLDFG